MPKLKTHQSIVKRFKITRQGKIMKKKAGQGHFNARESGKVTRNKRRSVKISNVNSRTIKSYMPH